ncbi:MAG: hypothetical protein ACD_39C00472G0001 [uncultured bacterium]|nr:MAG: hypothetical protein ACD_39C00472G0001 [uncultured bacterium]
MRRHNYPGVALFSKRVGRNIADIALRDQGIKAFGPLFMILEVITENVAKYVKVLFQRGFFGALNSAAIHRHHGDIKQTDNSDDHTHFDEREGHSIFAQIHQHRLPPGTPV